MSTPIYLDYNASTPVAQPVLEAMTNAAANSFGNPSSPHWAGSPARQVVETARSSLARLIGCKPHEIVFTSGGSEANNTVIKGVFFGAPKPPHIITTTVEHPATLAPCEFVAALGASISYLPVDGSGQINPNDLRKAIRVDTALITIMHSNNEVGTLQPIEACAQIAQEHGIPFHTDAAQSCGKTALDVNALKVDYMSLAGHKFYAPKGVGALYVRDGLQLTPLIHGASHERGQRAGTEAIAMLAALGAAAEFVGDLQPMAAVEKLRDDFWQALRARYGEAIVLNGHPTQRLANTLNVSLRGIAGQDVLAAMPEVAASTGSACHAGAVSLSPVLKAMGVSEDTGMGTIRFSLGRDTTQAEIDRTLNALEDALHHLGWP